MDNTTTSFYKNRYRDDLRFKNGWSTSSTHFSVSSMFLRRIFFMIEASLLEKSEKKGPMQAMM
jgi:hypothetical protein